MFTISEIKMRGFKSFKKADLQLVPGFNCLAGPNGSGKSNVLDSIRFVLGEQSLKSLRAKKVKDLICQDSKFADVALFLNEEGKKHEIRRAIRADGKVMYRLNGKRVTRSAVLEFLKKFSVDDTGRNIIAQGQVQRIIDMGGKSRREIIDGVAGISEFEDKKKEAMGELDVVDGRMREANLVLGEREAFLRDLEKEKNRALSYTSSRDRLKQVKATMIHQELASNTGRVEKINDKLSTMEEKGAALRKDMDSADAELAELEKNRAGVLEEIGKKRKREELFREMEDARAELGSHTQALSDGADNRSHIENDLSSVSKEIEEEEKEIRSIESKAAPLKKEVEALEKKKVSYSEDPAVSAVRSQLSALEKDAARVREERIQLEGEISRLSSLAEEKKRIADAYMEGGTEEAKSEKSIPALTARRTEAVQMIDRLFQKEKDLNGESAELDRGILEAREKLAVLRVQSSPMAMNPALRFLAGLKDKVRGMHGTVAELIEFDPKFSEAVDAAAGQRLLYMVVDDSSVAVECIKQLKSAGVGRATFIPLKEIRSSEASGKGGMGLLMDFLRFKPEHRKAVEFLFGSTILVSNSTEARKIGIGNARMVTLEGELFERSGAITGGKTRGGIAVSAQLSKAEKEADALRERKNGILSDLKALREEMSALRREKSELDVEIRKCELEAESAKKAEAESKKRRKIAEEAAKEIGALHKSVSHSQEKLAAYDSKLKELGKGISEKSEELAEAEKKSSEAMRSVEKEQQELTKLFSSKKAELDSMLREAEMRSRSIKEREARLKTLKSGLSALQKKLGGHSKRADELKSFISSLEKRIGESNKALEGLLQKSREFEERLQGIGKRKGSVAAETAKLDKQRYQLDLELASLNTRIADLKAELASYEGVQPLEEKDKEKLVEGMRSLEQQLSELGDVNLAAPEQYDKKSVEITEMKEKIEKLRVERNAIIDMVNSIEERKKAAFFEAFNAVNENFKEMFRHINLGEGYLNLDNPADLFNSGMQIRVKRNNRESSLDAFSGGEKTLLALMFIFALQFYKPSPFYILDEVDQSLDKANAQQLAKLLRTISSQSQFIVVTHDDSIMGMAEAILGVSRVDGVSRIVGVKMPGAA
ncbi:MAG: AAA family ATPase [Candidatus ainarchaeum sp.]|nr:AAA family ATPase [Candidatus ainarchaeum sp.]